MKIGYSIAVAAAVLLAGCGKQERTEAIQLTKALTASQAGFNQANNTERDFIASARTWCKGMTGNGAGHGAELDQNSSVAKAMAKTAVDISTQLSAVRQAVTGPTLTEEFPQGIRDGLINDLTKRQRTLQEMRAALELAAPQFLAYAKDKSYKGDTYPDGVDKVNAILQSYSVPDDLVGKALASLKEKYKFTAGEL